MAIKAIINNTEKEIEQIKNSNEQDIDYVYSRIGDTEVEGEPPISIKSIGGELANYRIYGNTVGGESVGDRTGNLFDENATSIVNGYIDNAYINSMGGVVSESSYAISEYIFIPEEANTISVNVPIVLYSPSICFYGNDKTYISGANYERRSVVTESIPIGAKYLRFTIIKQYAHTIMLNSGSTALPYEPYGYKVPVTVEGKNLFNENSLISPILVRDHYLSWYFDDEHYLLATDKSIDDRPWSYDYSQIHIALSSGTYTIRLSGVATSNQFAGIYITNSNNDRICSENISGKTSSVMTFTLNTPETIGIEIKVFDGKYRIMLVEGSTPLPYEPYHAPITTPIYLPEQIKKVGDEAEYIDYGEQKLHRVRKNLLQNTAKDREIDVTFTVNSDGSVTCNGTASATVSSDRISLSLPAGSYYLNGTPSGGSLSTYHMFVWYYNDEFELIWYNDIGDGVSFTIDNSYDVNVGIEIISGYTCNNLTFYPMIRKADIEDDTYEPYIENTDLDVTLPALSTIKGTNTFSVNTSIQPSNMYIKDNFDYKKVFTATRTIEGELPLNYKNIEDNDSTLSDYRIYGNTVGGESVGDLVESGEHAGEYEVSVTVEGKNLFDFGKWSKNINANDDNSLVKGIDGITITANSNDAFTTPYAYMHEGIYKIYVKPNTNYLLSWVSNNNLSGRVFIFKNGISYGTHVVNVNNDTTKYLLFVTDADTEFITLRFGVATAGNTITYSKIMLNEGSTALPYEPYHAPVTTPIYLPEPIKMVGDEAEYIDYGEQKLHRVRKNLLSNTATSRILKDVTFTVNEDDSVTCNGTASDTIDYRLVGLHRYSLPAGNYCLTGAPQTSSRSTYYLRVWYSSLTSTVGINDFGNGANFTLTDTTTLLCAIIIAPQQVLDNVTFYPMIRKADIEDDTYEPYIENTDLDVNLPALPTIKGTNVLSVGTAVQPSEVYIKGKIKEIN